MPGQNGRLPHDLAPWAEPTGAEFPMTAEELLEQAASVVRERRRTYGQPRDLFERVARAGPRCSDGA